MTKKIVQRGSFFNYIRYEEKEVMVGREGPTSPVGKTLIGRTLQDHYEPCFTSAECDATILVVATVKYIEATGTYMPGIDVTTRVDYVICCTCSPAFGVGTDLDPTPKDIPFPEGPVIARYPIKFVVVEPAGENCYCPGNCEGTCWEEDVTFTTFIPATNYTGENFYDIERTSSGLLTATITSSLLSSIAQPKCCEGGPVQS